MSATTSTHEHLTDCPACKKPITADVAYEVELAQSERVGEAATATLTARGVRVQHDCMPRATRH